MAETKMEESQSMEPEKNPPVPTGTQVPEQPQGTKTDRITALQDGVGKSCWSQAFEEMHL